MSPAEAVKPPFGNIAHWSASRPVTAIVIGLVIVLGLGAGMSQMDPGRITEAFVPDDLPALKTQREIEAIWGNSEGAFYLYLVDDPFSPQLLRAVAEDAEALQLIAFVRNTTSIPGLLEQQFGDLENVPDQQLRSTAMGLAEGPGAGLVSDDSLLLRIEMESGLNAVDVTNQLDEIANMTAADADLRPAGLIYIERMQTEGATDDVGILMPLSLVVVVIVLSLLFRRVQDVAVPLVTVLCAIMMAYGTVAWLGFALAPPSFIVMPLLLGLGVDYMLHIVYVYREQDNSMSLPERFRKVGDKVGLPVFYTAITTLIGFGSFMVSNIPQIRTWGVLIGSGALYAFILGFTLMPALYRIRRRREAKPSRQPLAKLTEKLGNFVPKYRIPVIVIGAGITIIMIAAATQITITPEVEFEPDNEAMPVQNLNLVEERYGGQTIAQFLLPAEDEQGLQDFEAELDRMDVVGFVDGPFHRLQRAGLPSSALGSKATEGVATDDWWRVIVGYDQENRDLAIVALENVRAELVPEARITGQDILQEEGNDTFLPNIGLSTLIALGLVLVLLFVIFRRPVAAFLAFVPLAITISWQLGIQTITGIPLNPITGVMTAMMIGVGVDYTIHMMVHFRDERRMGLTRELAAAAAIKSIGKPVLAATVTTVFAFSVLGFSSLLPLRDFGRVAAIVVTCAFIVSTTILPALLALRSYRKQRARQGEQNSSVPVASPEVSDHVVSTILPRFEDPEVQRWYNNERTGNQ